MKKKIKIFINILLFVVSFFISLFIIKTNSKVQLLPIFSDEFTINFLGAILAIGITIITFVFSSFDKIRNSLINVKIDTKQYNDINININQIFTALKEDLMAIFVFLTISFIVIILRDSNIPIIKWNWGYVSKSHFVSSIKLSMILLSFVGIFDIIYSLFALMRASEELSIKENKK